MEQDKKWMYTENALGRVETNNSIRKIQDRDSKDKVCINQIIWVVWGSVKLLDFHFRWKFPLNYEKMSSGWFLATENKVVLLSQTTEPVCLSLLPQSNEMFEDEDLTISLSEKKKNEVSEESSHCPCKNNITTNYSIVEMPFSLKDLQKTLEQFCVLEKHCINTVTKEQEVKMEGSMVSGVLRLRDWFAVETKSLFTSCPAAPATHTGKCTQIWANYLWFLRALQCVILLYLHSYCCFQTLG